MFNYRTHVIFLLNIVFIYSTVFLNETVLDLYI